LRAEDFKEQGVWGLGLRAEDFKEQSVYFKEQGVWRAQGVGTLLQKRASLTANALMIPEVDVMPIQFGITIICRRVRVTR